jgi:hypothetical protein
MSNEEMNKKMEFIVEQQAQFAADLKGLREVQTQDGNLLKDQYWKLSEAVITVVGLVGKLTQAQARADDRINVLMQAQARTDDRINVLAEVQTGTEERFNLLAQAQTGTEEAQTRTDESFNLLAQAQTRTEERLNIFINVVERHIAGSGGAENRA